ncbi:twin-arginine translocation signal domain-containing protein, partial [Dietzia schimae]|nr:twin-arginine translocation signal domain-containing protein [Dietzia kunjamensis subsp. schimae]
MPHLSRRGFLGTVAAAGIAALATDPAAAARP